MDDPKIMIVEDELFIAKNIQRILENNNYIVTAVVKTGEEAVRNAEKYKPDLVLMDIILDGEMSGIEASEIINQKFNIPVLFLTAHSDSETFNKAKLTLPFGYLTKPFDERQLIMAIEVAIYRDKSEKEKEKLRNEIKTLHGLLPICANCKKIRNEKVFGSK